jgi:hypothetical protein
LSLGHLVVPAEPSWRGEVTESMVAGRRVITYRPRGPTVFSRLNALKAGGWASDTPRCGAALSRAVDGATHLGLRLR